MNVNVQFREEGMCLKGFIEGEIDTYTASTLRDELSSIRLTENMQVILDLSNVSYMDSTGLGIFVGFYKSVKRENAELTLVGLTERLYRLFEITGLSELMNIDNSQKVELSNESI